MLVFHVAKRCVGDLGVRDHGAWADSFFFIFYAFDQKMNNQSDINAHLRCVEPVEIKELQLAQTWMEQRVQHLSVPLYVAQEGQLLEDDRLLFVMVNGPTMNDPIHQTKLKHSSAHSSHSTSFTEVTQIGVAFLCITKLCFVLWVQVLRQDIGSLALN